MTTKKLMGPKYSDPDEDGETGTSQCHWFTSPYVYTGLMLQSLLFLHQCDQQQMFFIHREFYNPTSRLSSYFRLRERLEDEILFRFSLSVKWRTDLRDKPTEINSDTVFLIVESWGSFPLFYVDNWSQLGVGTRAWIKMMFILYYRSPWQQKFVLKF